MIFVIREEKLRSHNEHPEKSEEADERAPLLD